MNTFRKGHRREAMQLVKFNKENMDDKFVRTIFKPAGKSADHGPFHPIDLKYVPGKGVVEVDPKQHAA